MKTSYQLSAISYRGKSRKPGAFSQCGQSLIEVVVALSVATIVITALLVVVINSLRNAQFAQTQSRATKSATEGIERVRTIRDRDGAVDFNYGGRQASKFSELWAFSLNQTCSSSTSTGCAFKINPEGVLTKTTLETEAEDLGSGMGRQIVIEDGAGSYQNEKIIRVRVFWTDSAGQHQSNLETILGRVE